MIRILALCLVATPALADVDAVLDGHVLPRVAAFANASATLANAPCEAGPLEEAFADAAIAWAGMSHLTLGPVEEADRGLSILFWPDDRDATGRGLRLLIAQGETAWTPDALTRASAAARGLGALERLIVEGGEPCLLTGALADDLAAQAAALNAGWDAFAPLLRDPGGANNLRFLTEREAQSALYSVLTQGIEALKDRRLGEPMGTFDAPHPLRAELRRSGLSQAMALASAGALAELAAALTDAPDTVDALRDAEARLRALDDPSFAGVEDPGRRVALEAVQADLLRAQTAAAREIAGGLGLTTGFNALDGD
ncbi:imelysin family protein [Wenxinia saemankumensis]|uniref:Imelysin-like domain-containing protein n=1 Tax=Wenxinia saemankumensis TaxID=1447782 RepID=A0A1M6B5N1_9RHOB|nr:imelysin family protein [Wenxinia saemankumensis]SHI44041.1 hypothetical protein SAMN05444417_0793 [Wenxinia saemankumensis]